MPSPTVDNAAARTASRLLTAAQVVQSYRMILGRDPESDEAIQNHLNHFRTQEALNAAMRESPEIRERFSAASDLHLRSPYLGQSPRIPRGHVEHETSPDILEAMLARIQAQWAKLGEEDPHYSVISQPEYRAENLDQRALDAFHAGGVAATQEIDLFASQAGVDIRFGVCIELGCGVGRLTRHLADRFEHVYAVDISPGNLAACDAYLAEADVTNVTTVLARSLDDLDALPAADCVYSFIVLQHNPPPVQKQLLRRLFARTNPGGVVLFQIPTDMKDYSFEAATYLNSPHPEMEMHCLPRPVVLAEMHEAGLRVLDVVADDCLGEYGSSIFFGIRPDPSNAARP